MDKVPLSLEQWKALRAIASGKLRKIVAEDIGLLYTTVGGVGSSILGALFWLILASIFSVDNYGLVNYYIALAQILAGVGLIGLNTTVTAYLAKGETELLYETNSIILISGLVCALILSAFHWAAGLLSATLVFFTMAQAEILGKKAYKEYAFALIGQRIAQISLSLVLYFPLGLTGIVLGYFAGALIFSYRYFISLKNFTLKLTSIREKRNFALHSYGYNLLGKTLSNYIDKVIIGILFGYYDLGLYQLCFQFFMFLDMIPVSLQQYLLPEESSGNNKQKIKIIALILAVAAFLFLFTLSPYLISTLFPSFTEAVPMVRLISLSVIPSTIVAMLTASFLGNENSKIVFSSSIIYLTSLLVCLVVLGLTVGVLGLSLAIVFGKTIQAIFLLLKRNTV